MTDPTWTEAEALGILEEAVLKAEAALRLVSRLSSERGLNRAYDLGESLGDTADRIMDVVGSYGEWLGDPFAREPDEDDLKELGR